MSTNKASIPNTTTMSIPWMHGCDVIVRNWDEDLGRGRRMQRGYGWVKVPAEQRTDSLTELCEFANMAYDVLEAAERKPALLEWLETSAASPEDSAPISSASQISPSEHSVETPPTQCSKLEHHEPGWGMLDGRSSVAHRGLRAHGFVGAGQINPQPHAVFAGSCERSRTATRRPNLEGRSRELGRP